MNSDNKFFVKNDFTCQGETLTLNEIVTTKKITSVTIGYLSKERKIKARGLKGLFGYKEVVQDDKEITITDPKGITLNFVDGEAEASIRFWEKNEFDKLADENYDENTLGKRYVFTIVHPYQINFHIGNLEKIEWTAKSVVLDTNNDFAERHSEFRDSEC